MYRIICSFYKLGYVNESNDKIVMLGLQRIKNLAEDIFAVVLVSWIMGNIIVGFIFEMVYIPLKVYAGGFHASSERMCKYISLGSGMICLLIIFFVPIENFVMYFLQVFSWIAILLLSPVESKRHLLSDIERKIFRRRSIVIALSEIIVCFWMMTIGALSEAKTICVAVFLVVVGLIIGQ